MNDGTDDRARSTVRALWERRRPAVLARVDALAALVEDLGADRDAEATRDRAERDAHRLAGTLAAFGVPEGARIARALEQDLGAQRFTGMPRAARLVGDLRAHLDGPQNQEDYARGTRARVEPFLLLVTTDADAAHATAQAAAARGLRTETVADLRSAQRVIAEHAPEAVLVGPVGDWPAMVAFVERLSRRAPGVPVLFMTSPTAYGARLEAVLAGARAVVPPTVSPAEIVGLVESILERERQDSDSLLVVDDDPVFLTLVESLLAAAGLRVTTLDDARRFWETLEDVGPDLVLLDLSMPHTSGIELCRVLRADPRWAGLPVIMLTGRDEAVAAQSAFAVGADDYVVKAKVGPELITRITNRLDRVRLYRDLADRDPLTGLVNRRKFSEEASRLLRLAERNQQPLAFVMIDLDQFKQVNDRFGHAIGDKVLHRLARVLTDVLRDEDVVGRWGGEEFALAMFGMTRAEGVQRVTDVLDAFRQETFVSRDGTPFSCTFSAGVAQLPEDGKDTYALYQAADEALLQAKAAGRGRVLPTGSHAARDHRVRGGGVTTDTTTADLLHPPA